MSCAGLTVGLLDPLVARRQLIELAVPLCSGRQPVALAQARGRVLAEDARARFDMPGVDNSAMDGYALRLAEANASGLPVAQRVPAGATPAPLAPGGCARIFTGAPVPPGADCVVPQERVEIDAAGRLRVADTPQAGANIRRRGEEYRAGHRLLTAGTRLTSPALALLASQGIAEVAVRPRLRVALLSTGDELREPGAPYRPGVVYNSNRVLLEALLAEQGCEVLDLGIVADTAEALSQALTTARDRADLVITTGGVSVGEEDHVRPVVEGLGRVVMHGLAMKPGKPFTFGYLGETPLFGLPGNPVASQVGWHLLVLPFVQGCQGRQPAALQRYPLPAGFSRRGTRGRCELLRVVLAWQDGEAVAYLAGGQGSGMLAAASQAHGYLLVPAGVDVQEGRDYAFLPMAQFLD